MTPNDLYAFLSDKRLVDLIERVKISDDFLDVVSLTETQHPTCWPGACIPTKATARAMR